MAELWLTPNPPMANGSSRIAHSRPNPMADMGYFRARTASGDHFLGRGTRNERLPFNQDLFIRPSRHPKILRLIA